MTIRPEATLALKPVGKITGNFVVPAYQRGYRWGEHHVKHLLMDIWENGDKPYCLQPIVVKRSAEGQFELIDGQQRLTTLYLVFLYMVSAKLKNIEMPFSITYTTRPRSGSYLATLDPAEKDDNIDFFHIYNAYEFIQQWFLSRNVDKQEVADDYYRYFNKWVKVIWYEVADDVDSVALFSRLNIGRIPLTNAELTKALFLRRTVGEPGTLELQSRAKYEYVQQVEIATQWDSLERELQDDGFWAFLTNQKAKDFPTRIELLFDLMAGKRKGDKNQFATFEHFQSQLIGRVGDDVWKARSAIWQEILQLGAMLKEWHDDRDLYHKVGYLVATDEKEAVLASLITKAKGMTKSSFLETLDGRIRDSLNLSAADIEELSYKKHSPKIERLLLLFNVESARTLKNSSEKYPFDVHKSQAWTLEHIHAQNAEDLNKVEQWQEWVKQHDQALEALNPHEETAKSERARLLRAIQSLPQPIHEAAFKGLAPAVVAFFSRKGEDDMHGIGNLALLSSGVNSALKNAVFEVKRRRIIERDSQGDYVPICTRRVFLKYYTAATGQQVHFWSQHDREEYVIKLVSSDKGVGNYLKPSK